MGGDTGKDQEVKIFLKSESKKASRFSDAIIVALITCVTTLLGLFLTRAGLVSQIETAQRAAINEIQAARDIAENQLSFELRAHIFAIAENAFSDSGSYENQASAVIQAYVLGGVDGALYVHAAFRSGATVHALERIYHLEDELNDGRGDAQINLSEVERALQDVPSVLFLESTLDENIYCQTMEGTGRTNIDAFSPGLRDLPMRMVAKRFTPGATEAGQIGEILELITNQQPDLIVAHLSTFELESDLVSERDNRYNILQEILSSASELVPSYDPSLIVYSRLRNGQREGEVDFPLREELMMSFPSDHAFFSTISMVGHDDDSDQDCFLIDPENTRRLREEVSLAISHQELYERSTSE